MKSHIVWLLSSAFLMIGCPWMAVTFAGSAGMAVCFILFFAANPLFSAMCGAFAGKHIRQNWFLPVISAGLFLAGTWLFFDMGEPAFLLYGGVYLAIGLAAMLLRSFFERRRKHI